jgi:hypothetical protein
LTQDSRVLRGSIRFAPGAGSAPAVAVAFFSFVLLTAPPAGGAGNDKLLTGEYAEAGTATCLYAPGGFNTILQPKVPANAVVTTESLNGFGPSTGPARSEKPTLTSSHPGSAPRAAALCRT